MAPMGSAAFRYTDTLSPATEGYLKSRSDMERFCNKFLSC